MKSGAVRGVGWAGGAGGTGRSSTDPEQPTPIASDRIANNAPILNRLGRITHIRQAAVQPAREPPIPAPEDAHQGRGNEAAHDGHVHEDRNSQSQPPTP